MLGLEDLLRRRQRTSWVILHHTNHMMCLGVTGKGFGRNARAKNWPAMVSSLESRKHQSKKHKTFFLSYVSFQMGQLNYPQVLKWNVQLFWYTQFLFQDKQLILVTHPSFFNRGVDGPRQEGPKFVTWVQSIGLKVRPRPSLIANFIYFIV